MNLEDQVCCLEYAQRLKELGVNKKSLFYYQNNPYNDGQDCMDLMIKEKRSKNNENVLINTETPNYNNPRYSAFTVAELGELLPDFIVLSKVERIYISTAYGEDINNKNNISFIDDTEANVRAKMIIYLIENKLIEV